MKNCALLNDATQLYSCIDFVLNYIHEEYRISNCNVRVYLAKLNSCEMQIRLRIISHFHKMSRRHIKNQSRIDPINICRLTICKKIFLLCAEKLSLNFMKCKHCIHDISLTRACRNSCFLLIKSLARMNDEEEVKTLTSLTSY